LLLRTWVLLLVLACFVSAASSVQAQAIEQAILTGNALLVVNPDDLVDAAITEIGLSETVRSEVSGLYDAEQISYTPGNSSQLIRISAGVPGIWPILLGNGGEVLAAAGLKGAGRFAAFGMSPMKLFQDGTNLSYEPQLKRILAWLLNGEPIDSTLITGPKTIALSFSSDDRTDTLNWIAAAYPNWTVIECNDVATLASCYSGVELIMTGRRADDADAQAIVTALSDASTIGIPVLYKEIGWGTNEVAEGIGNAYGFTLPYGGNFWANDAASWTDVNQMQQAIFAALGYEPIRTMLQHFKANDYAFDWSACNGEDCASVVGLDTEFTQGSDAVRAVLNDLDTAKINLFTDTGFRLEKLLALIADHYRQQITYPMDKVTTDDNAFLKSYYADHAVYTFRPINPAQLDMGNFSRSDFSHIAPLSKNISLTSKKNFRAAGVYALPGQTFRVTRNDTSNLTVKIFVNTVRSGATHEWAANGYLRPKYLQSQKFAIAPGETIELTSPYGGPIQVDFGSNDLPVVLAFENIGEHPFWNGAEDDATFTQQLNDGHYDWAELVTPGFEVHSKLEKMLESLADARWGSAVALAAGASQYMHNYPHVLAGFQGPGVAVEPEIHDFASANGWTINNLDLVKHMNADQAACGYGCSGNPYDAYWAFDPTGHGDVHELGHGLQGGMRFVGWVGHSMTNYYSYYTKSKYHLATGGAPECQSLPFESNFTILQASINQPDPAAYMQAQLWAGAGWSDQAAMYIELMMAAQADGALQEGWFVRARAHLIEREFNRATVDEPTWLAKRDSLGFSQYSLAQADLVDNNDWLLIALSYVLDRDLRDYLSMWGIPYSATADAQVASLGFTSLPRQYYVGSADGFCYGLDKPSLPVDGLQVWPAETDSDADGMWDAFDNCALTANPLQEDLDTDSAGDVCDDDIDGDGLINTGESTRGTDAYNSDSDGDGYTDGEEVAAGRDPLNPASIPGAIPVPALGFPALLLLALVMITTGIARSRPRKGPSSPVGA
jgi:hypothetical protein